MKKLSLLALSMMSLFFLTAQTPGTLYHLFGDNGIVLTDYDEVGNYSYASALQDNMKIVLGGITLYTGASGTVENIMVTRYNSYGSIDMGFADDGIKVLEYGGSDDWLTDIAIQPDGKIVGVGHTTSGSKTKMLAFRLNTDGSLDNSFHIDGMAVIDFGEHVNAYGMSLGICEDGKIVISGYVRDTVLSYSEIAMCKLLPTGFLDTDFGYFGLATYEEQDLFCFPDELVIHNDRIILGGIFLNADFERFAVISGYHLNGEIDYSFGNVGYTSVMLEGDATIMGGAANNGMCVAPDGKILYTCNQVPGWLENDMALLRLNPDGGIDYSFGTNGVLVNAMDVNTSANDVITQADGKIIVCGTYRSPDPGSYDFLVMRYHENGDLDTDFGSDGTGIVITQVSSEVQWYGDKSYNLMFCNMDRLLVSGYGRTISGGKDFAMACYNTGLDVGISKHEASEIDFSVHPNPVVDQVDISFSLAHSANVEIEIHNVSGTLVSKISDTFYPEGEHQLRWNCEELPAGMYITKLTIGDKTYTSKIIKSH